jgi:hypothetical protein
MSTQDKAKNAEKGTGKIKEQLGKAADDNPLKPKASATRPKATSGTPAKKSKTPSKSNARIRQFRWRTGGCGTGPRQGSGRRCTRWAG